jgi:hypothetical protein
MIKTYNNLQDYASGLETPVSDSSLFRCTNPNVLTLKGYNVEVNDVKVGDVVAYDSNNKIRYVALDTWNYPGTAEFKSMGVVANVLGNLAYVAHKTNASKKWSQIYRWEVTGFGSATTSVVTLNGTAIGTLSDLDGTAATLVSKFNELFAAYKEDNPSYTAVYHMYEQDDKVFLAFDTYTSHPSGTTSMTNITVTVSNGPEVPAISTNYRKTGVSIYWGGMNLPRFIEYYRTNGKTPTADVSVTATDPVTIAAFNTSQYCAALRETYGTYENYMDWNMVRWPNTKGVMSDVYRDGKKFTYDLANKTYPNPEGVDTVQYPADNYAANTGYTGVSGFEKGDWFMLSPFEMMPIWGSLTYGITGLPKDQIDPINRSLDAVGGNKISVSSYSWSSLRSNPSYAWTYGYLGYLNYITFSYGFTVVPFSLLHC